jgi:hypothetical protein
VSAVLIITYLYTQDCHNSAIQNSQEEFVSLDSYPGADPGFQVRGAHFKKLRRAEGGAKIFGVFCVKNHHFTQKNHIFSNFRGCAPLDSPLI